MARNSIVNASELATYDQAWPGCLLPAWLPGWLWLWLWLPGLLAGLVAALPAPRLPLPSPQPLLPAAPSAVCSATQIKQLLMHKLHM